MRKVIVVLIFFLNLIKAQSAESEWKWLNPSPTGNDIIKLQFINPRIGWAFCKAPEILKTEDYGYSWQSYSIPERTSLNCGQFLNDSIGYCGGNFGFIAKSSDGGKSWNKLDINSNGDVNDLSFINENEGWITVSDGTIKRTSNGGLTWTSDTTGVMFPIIRINFLSSLIGWTCDGIGDFRKTLDGGITWSNLNTHYLGLCPNIFFLDTLRGWAVGNSGMSLRTTNGGVNWDSISTATNEQLSTVFFSDSIHGWAAGSSGLIIRTDDGGSTWFKIDSNPNRNYNSIYFVAQDTGYCAGANGRLIKTISNASGWDSLFVSIDSYFQDIKFVTTDSGWAVCSDGSVYFTSNSGAVWAKQTSNNLDALTSVEFINSQIGHAVGLFGRYLTTTDAGATWITSNSFPTDLLSYIKFFSPNNGFTVGNFGAIFRTFNGGLSWDSIPSFTQNLLLSVSVPQNNKIFVLSLAGEVFKSSDNGLTWANIFNVPVLNTYSMHFFNDSTGLVAAIDSSSTLNIYRTTDGGLTWTKTMTPYSNLPLNKMSFVNSTIGYAVGDGGNILYTNNGGLSWRSMQNGCGDLLLGLSIADKQNVFAVGANKSIIKLNKYSILDDPTIISPKFKEKKVSVSPTIKWLKSNNATFYKIQISKDSAFLNKVITLSTADTTIVVTGLEYQSSYYVRVKAFNLTDSSYYSDTYFSTGLMKPTLLYPHNNAKKIYQTVNLVAEKISNVNRYFFEYSLDSSFLNSTILLSSDSSIMINNLTNNSKYFWRLRYENNGDTSEWSEVRRFSTKIDSPILISPINNTINVDTSLYLSWKINLSTTNYIIEIADNIQFNSSRIITETDTFSLITGLAKNTTYYWRVRSVAIEDTSEYSEIWSFKTKSDLYSITGSVKYPKYKTPTSAGVKTFSIIAYNPMPLVPWVKLLDSNGAQIDSTKADTITGNFAFGNLANGKYILALDSSMAWKNSKPWQLSIIDVNLVKKTVGLVYSFDALQSKSANINLDKNTNGTPKVNIQDVNAMKKRVGLVVQPSIWKISNYVYAIETDSGMTSDMTVIINGANKIVNVRCLSAGDVNGQ